MYSKPSHRLYETVIELSGIREKEAVQNIQISVGLNASRMKNKRSYSTDLGYPDHYAIAIEKAALQKRTDSTRPTKTRKENLLLQ